LVRRTITRTLAGALCGAVLAVATAWKVGGAAWEDPFAPFVEPGFPFIVSTVDAGKLGAAFPERNLAVRCVVLMLGNETYACFDTDLLRMSVAWHGGFVSMTTMAQVSYQQAFNKNNQIPRVLGQPIVATGIYPGWMGATPSYGDPRPASANPADVGRGPIAPSAGRWNGLHVVKDAAVLSYTVEGTSIDEQVSSVTSGAQAGIARTFRTGAVARPLTLVVAEVGGVADARVEGSTATVLQGTARDTATVVGITGAPAGARLQVDSNRFVTLRVPAGPAATFRVVAWRGRAEDRAVVTSMLAKPVEIASTSSAVPHWPQTVETHGVVSPDTADYVTDRVTLPLPNPWRRNVRISDVDFFQDGRAAVTTFDGDVWIVSGLDRGLGRVQWKRFASGLYEPLNVAVVHDTVYVLDRQGIVRLRDVNGDGEADDYENFSNLLIASGESREYPLGLAKKADGGFYVSIGGALDNGPKTSPQTMPGFRAGSPHSGTVQEISADGRAISTFATGLREPNIGIDPRTGRLASSDQQGNFVPSTPVYLLRRGGYYNVTPTAHGADTTAGLPPLVWIPHEVDASGAGEVWVTGDKMGFGGDALVHLSYAKPGPFRVYVDSTRGVLQGAIMPLPGLYTTPTLKGRMHPADGQLYLAGFQIWQSNAKDVSSLTRLRYTGKPSTLPLAVHAGQQGIVVRFASRLDAASARDASHYQLQSWHYVRSSAYGSGHFKRDGTAGHDRLDVAAHLSSDGRSVLLVVPDMKPAMQMQLDYDLRTREGAKLASTLYLTVHSVDPMSLASAGFGSVDWRASARRAASKGGAAVAATSSAEKGAQIYQRTGCIACHSINGVTAGKTGPTFKGLYGSSVKLVGKPARIANDAYLMQSILDPGSEIVQGYEPGMPSFKGVLSDAEIRSVVLYLKELK